MHNQIKDIIISITGDLGSGKTTVSNEINKIIPFSIFSTGTIQRQIAIKHSMTTLELNKYSETHPEIDKEIDDFVKSLNKQKGNLLIDSRMAWHFVSKSFKVYLEVNPGIAAERIMKDDIRKSEKYADISEAIKSIEERKKSENLRFKSFYHVDCSDYKNYNLIINTEDIEAEKIAILLLKQLKNWKDKQECNSNIIWVSPKILYPTEHSRNLGSDMARNVFSSVEKDGYDFSSIVEVVKFNHFYYIFDGHKRVSSAILNSIPIIPIMERKDNKEEVLPGLNAEKFCHSHHNKSWFYDWEDCLNFRFQNYPEI